VLSEDDTGTAAGSVPSANRERRLHHNLQKVSREGREKGGKRPLNLGKPTICKITSTASKLHGFT